MNQEKNKGAEYDFYGKLPLQKAILLGLQHVFAMFVGNPPIMEAPMIAPYPRIPPPITDATLLQTPINPELVPMMIGTFPPIGPIAYNWISVTIPAINIAFCKSAI